MSIQELSRKFKGVYANTEILLALLIITVSSLSFFLGRLSVQQKTQEIEHSNQPALLHEAREQSEPQKAPTTAVRATSTQSTTGPVQTVQGAYVASKTGTKYHLPWCAGAKQIKESNKVWFGSKEEAEKSGYTPASNCKGI